MSYITLYLTFEYAIVPLLMRRIPAAGPRTIDGVKNRYFYNILADRPTDDTQDRAASARTPFHTGNRSAHGISQPDFCQR